MKNKYCFICFGSIPVSNSSLQIKNTRIFANVDSAELFDTEISVFKADENGLPVIENIDQARLLAEKIGYTAYGLNGNIIGQGHDQEPIIKDIHGEQINITDETLQKVIIDFLSSNYEASGSKDESEKQSTIYSFYDINIHKHYLKYMGIRFD